MIETKLTKEKLFEFLADLRDEDKLELDEFLKTNSFDDFLKDCFNKNNLLYFLTTDKNEPLALGGAYKIEKNVAKVWLLVTNKYFKHKIALFKYVKNKISKFKNEFDILYNFIFKSNFSSLVWLKKCGFSVLNLNISDYKLFYFNKGEKSFDIRYLTCK